MAVKYSDNKVHVAYFECSTPNKHSLLCLAEHLLDSWPKHLSEFRLSQAACTYMYSTGSSRVVLDKLSGRLLLGYVFPALLSRTGPHFHPIIVITIIGARALPLPVFTYFSGPSLKQQHTQHTPCNFRA